MLRFTNLERVVLAAICDAQEGTAEPLRALLATAQMRQRENTGHGFFTYFEVDQTHGSVATQSNPLYGLELSVKVGGQVLLMGFLIWFTGGYPDCLEGFQYSTEAGENIDLKAEDLFALVPLGPMK